MAKREQREKEAAANAAASSPRDRAGARAARAARLRARSSPISARSRAGVSVHALGERFLEDGSQGDDVEELQRFLQGTGHFTHKDGRPGAAPRRRPR